MPVAVDGRKVCSKCRTEKSVDDFTASSRTSDRRQAWCRRCTADASLTHWRAKSYDERTAANLMRLYGITWDDFQERLTSQDGVCAICRRPERRRFRGRVARLVVDHCHRTGRVRGLLCSDCNVAIARFSDSVDVLRAAVAYLERANHG